MSTEISSSCRGALAAREDPHRSRHCARPRLHRRAHCSAPPVLIGGGAAATPAWSKSRGLGAYRGDLGLGVGFGGRLRRCRSRSRVHLRGGHRQRCCEGTSTAPKISSARAHFAKNILCAQVFGSWPAPCSRSSCQHVHLRPRQEKLRLANKSSSTIWAQASAG